VLCPLTKHYHFVTPVLKTVHQFPIGLSLFFARPKKSNQKKRRHQSQLPQRFCRTGQRLKPSLR
jgi:hypothetical protein